MLYSNITILVDDKMRDYKNDLGRLNKLYTDYENIKKEILEKTLENKKINDEIELYEFQLKELNEYPLSADFEKSITIALPTVCPARLVPPPLGRTGILYFFASCIVLITSSCVLGKTIPTGSIW